MNQAGSTELICSCLNSGLAAHCENKSPQDSLRLGLTTQILKIKHKAALRGAAW